MHFGRHPRWSEANADMNGYHQQKQPHLQRFLPQLAQQWLRPLIEHQLVNLKAFSPVLLGLLFQKSSNMQ